MRSLALGLLLLPALAAADPTLRLEVEGKGVITIALDAARAPKTVAQIVRLAKAGFYDDMPFFRVERTPRPYLAWFGDPASRKTSADPATLGKGGSGKTVPFEDSGLRHTTGAVGLSRPLDDKNGGDSVFYIVLEGASFLDGKYTVFGRVSAGMDVVGKLQRGDKVSRVTVLN